MLKTDVKKTYKCEFCGDTYQSKSLYLWTDHKIVCPSIKRALGFCEVQGW